VVKKFNVTEKNCISQSSLFIQRRNAFRSKVVEANNSSLRRLRSFASKHDTTRTDILETKLRCKRSIDVINIENRLAYKRLGGCDDTRISLPKFRLPVDQWSCWSATALTQPSGMSDEDNQNCSVLCCTGWAKK